MKTRSAVVFVVAESTRRPASALSNHRYGVLNVELFFLICIEIALVVKFESV